MVKGIITIEYIYDEKNPENTGYEISETAGLDNKSIIDILTFIVSNLDDIQE